MYVNEKRQVSSFRARDVYLEWPESRTKGPGPGLNILGRKRLDELDLGADVAIACLLEVEPVDADVSTESVDRKPSTCEVRVCLAQSRI
ncbi:hypothetical protein GN244_ATG08727 [Phytophthora infestans]|uniref:Uncharacterized protein n=1 Tax=Phytophthora infestans TaxID=4787 RepID=A0A833WKA3_PHYIN|nr:hypothetical protein GN244_ATG08727 [Phytophthora infestans]